MQRLAEQIFEHEKRLPEGTPVAAKSLLHLRNRAAVDQSLSRLTERSQLLRAGRGVSCCRSRAGSAPGRRRWSRRSRHLPPSAARSSSQAVRRPPTASALRRRYRSERFI